MDPWDRRPGEGSKAYEHFQIFLDMGADRTLRDVAAQVSKSEQYIRRLSTDHEWQARARAWDSMPRRAVVDAYQEMAAATVAKHRAIADKLLAKLDKSLDALPEGADPSIRWSTAHGAAVKSHALALDTAKPASTATDEINKAIVNLLDKLAGE